MEVVPALLTALFACNSRGIDAQLSSSVLHLIDVDVPGRNSQRGLTVIQPAVLDDLWYA